MSGGQEVNRSRPDDTWAAGADSHSYSALEGPSQQSDTDQFASEPRLTRSDQSSRVQHLPAGRLKSVATRGPKWASHRNASRQQPSGHLSRPIVPLLSHLAASQPADLLVCGRLFCILWPEQLASSQIERPAAARDGSTRTAQLRGTAQHRWASRSNREERQLAGWLAALRQYREPARNNQQRIRAHSSSPSHSSKRRCWGQNYSPLS